MGFFNLGDTMIDIPERRLEKLDVGLVAFNEGKQIFHTLPQTQNHPVVFLNFPPESFEPLNHFFFYHKPFIPEILGSF